MPFFDYPTYQIPEPEEAIKVTVSSSILVLVEGSQLVEKEQELLSKILKSVQQDLDKAQIQFVNKGEHVLIHQGETKSQILIIAFGIQPLRCHLQVENELYELILIGKKTYLFAAPLGVLPNHPNDRRALWVALKEYFNIQ